MHQEKNNGATQGLSLIYLMRGIPQLTVSKTAKLDENNNTKSDYVIYFFKNLLITSRIPPFALVIHQSDHSPLVPTSVLGFEQWKDNYPMKMRPKPEESN